MGASASIQEEVMLEFERAMLTKIEEIRTARGRDILVKRLEDRVPHYKDKEYHDPKSTAIQITVEGKQPVLDALKYLKGARIEENGTHSLESDFSPVPAPPLRCSSQDHAFDVGTVGTASHTSSNGESPGERMSRYCCWQQTCSEVIYYGALAGNDKKSIRDIAQDVIDALIIDDGVESRGHRLADEDDALGPLFCQLRILGEGHAIKVANLICSFLDVNNLDIYAFHPQHRLAAEICSNASLAAKKLGLHSTAFDLLQVSWYCDKSFEKNFRRWRPCLKDMLKERKNPPVPWQMREMLQNIGNNLEAAWKEHEEFGDDAFTVPMHAFMKGALLPSELYMWMQVQFEAVMKEIMQGLQDQHHNQTPRSSSFIDKLKSEKQIFDDEDDDEDDENDDDDDEKKDDPALFQSSLWIERY